VLMVSRCDVQPARAAAPPDARAPRKVRRSIVGWFGSTHLHRRSNSSAVYMPARDSRDAAATDARAAAVSRHATGAVATGAGAKESVIGADAAGVSSRAYSNRSMTVWYCSSE
jgi:hypothetical protein